MANFTKLNQEEINFLFNHYDVGNVSNFQPMDGGAANSSFIVQNGRVRVGACPSFSRKIAWYFWTGSIGKAAVSYWERIFNFP